MVYLLSALAGLYAYYKNINLLAYLVILLIIISFLSGAKDQGWKKSLGLCLGLFLVFYLRPGLFHTSLPKDYRGPMQVKILSCIKKDESYQVKLRLNKIKTKALVYTKIPMDPGSQWVMNLDLKEEEGPSDWSGPYYRDYLFSQGISYTGFASPLKKVQGPGVFSRIQEGLLGKLEKGPYLSQASQSLFNQVVLNKKTSNSWADDLKDLGLSHILAISGLHLGLLYGGLALITIPLLGKNKGQWLAFGFATFYLCIIQGSVSGLRVLAFLFFSIYSRQKGQRFHFDRLFILLFCLQLFLFPRVFYSLGFYLSYGAYFSIHRLRPFIEDLFKPFTNPWVQSLALGLAVCIGILPLTLGLNYEVNLAQILSNILLLPLYTGFIVLSFIYALISLLGGPLGLLAYGLNTLTNLLLWGNELMETYLPLGISLGKPSLEGILLFYTCLWLLVYGSSFKKYPLFGRSILVFSLGLMLCQGLSIKDGQGIYFIYVGQGDASLICKDFKNTLIDTGGSRTYRPGRRYTLPFIQARGLSTLDQVVITHWDADHCDGLLDLIGRVDIKRVYSGHFPPKAKDILRRFNIETRVLKEGDRVKIAEGSYLEVVFSDPLAEDENNRSLVLLYEEAGRKILFPGDMEKEVEDQLHLSPVDLYHVAHHGSKTSSSKGLLAQIQPRLAIISAGKDNSYGHPHGVTLGNLKSIGAKTYSLQDAGSLKLRVRDLSLSPTLKELSLDGRAYTFYLLLFALYLYTLERSLTLELSRYRTGNVKKRPGPPIW